jgi:mRNA-degrading endonuclease RelE of RelBE toxin-antitoxin system
MCVYRVEFAESAIKDLAELSAYGRAAIAEALREQLVHEPTKPTRNRKPLSGRVPAFEAAHPIWELRVGEYRVFYDLDLEEKSVTVRAIRHKPPHKTTEEVL